MRVKCMATGRTTTEAADGSSAIVVLGAVVTTFIGMCTFNLPIFLTGFGSSCAYIAW
jgi:uncharacterized membrane protein YuzA (DUF378 family)